MATARRREAWDHTAAVMSWVGRLADTPFQPDRMNPYRQGPAGNPAAVNPEREAAAGWAVLGGGLRNLKG